MRIKNKRLMIFGICCCLTAAAFAATDNTVELVRDPLKLVIYPKTGNFCLYHATVNDKNFYAPLYDDRAQSSVNVYSVQFNGKMFHLNNKSRKKILIEQLHDEIIVTFQTSFDFLVRQRFSFADSKNRSTGPFLKIVTEIQNISGEVANVAVKAVFDVSLGEKNTIPLYTDLRSEIGSELLLQPALEKDRVIFSADKGYACMFFLRNEYMTTPSSVYIANWERLMKKTWLPSYQQGRSFRKYSSSDPGILYVWSEKKVENQATLAVTNCIGFYDYRYTSSEGITNLPADAERPMPEAVQPEPEQAPSEPEAAQKETEPVSVQPDYAFVQKLLDKIAALEQSPDTASDEEIQALKKEVDNAIKALQEE